MPTSAFRWFLLIVAIAVVYFVTARLSLLLAFEQTSSSPVWPPAGIGLAAVLLLGYRVLPGILIGVFIANVMVFVSNQSETVPIIIVLTSLCIAGGSTLEPFLGAFLFRRFIGHKNSIDRGQDAFTFVAVGALSCMTSSTIGPASICIAGLAPWDIVGIMSFTWWLGDLSGVLIMTPLFLGWSRQLLTPISISKGAELSMLLILLFLTSQFAFGGWIDGDLTNSLAYLLIPFLLWIAFRFGQQVSTVAIALISGLTIWATTHGTGPFLTESLNTSLILVQGFVCVIAITIHVLAAIVSEKREALETVRESEKKYRSLFDDATDMIHIVNNNGRIIDANKIEMETLGYSEDEYIGMPLIEIIHPDYRIEAKNKVEKIFRGIPIKGHQTALMSKNGEKIFVEVNTVPQLSDGKIINAKSIIRDVTERRRMEEALRESEAKFRNIAENSLVGVYIIQDGIFIYVNPKFANIFGYSIEKIINNMQFLQLVYPQDHYIVQEQVNKRVSGAAKSVYYTFRGIKKNREIIHVEIFGSSIILNGKPAATGTMLDITDRKRMETNLQQAQKLESIGNLAGGIAHDFNNILSAVLGYTELALDDVQRGSHLEGNLQEIFTAGKRARDLVKQILAFARQSDAERKPIRVDTIAKEVLKLIRSTIPSTIEIREEIESRSLIMGNPSQVHQLLMNLCTNSAQSMEDVGGILKVDLIDVEHSIKTPLPLPELKSGDYIKLTVSDTGPGISPDIIDSVFEPYFTTKGVGEGTGMGLALAHGIVESYGGKITVDSELGKGTVFLIYLPITKKRENYRPNEKEELPSGTEKILFVDDELPIAKMGSQILERLGYQVTVRTSSDEALELFRSKPGDFDLVISDMTMPNMTGDELAMELIAFRPNIPVILCTGYSKKISEETAFEIGIKAFAYKPLVKSDLAKTIRKVLDESNQ
jgi:PAS domain S-box-containing protein